MKKHLLFTFIITLLVININAQIISTVAGNGTAGYSGDGGSATAAELNSPYGIALDAAGNLYIADFNNRIRKVTTAGIITTVAGDGTAGYTGDGGSATAAELNVTYGVALDAAGNMYIADKNNRRIRKVNTAGIISTFAGNGTGGYTGDGGYATAAVLSSPTGICIAGGNLYIADGTNLIRKVNTAGIITTIAGDTTGISTGLNGGFSGDGGQATAAALNHPLGVALDAAGNIYIADYFNNRIRKVTTAGIITTVAGNGSEGYSGDGGSATAAALYSPMAVALDAASNLYIADCGSNNVIRKVNTAGIITTIAGNGTGGYTGDGGYATAAELLLAEGVAFDVAGNLYIADNWNNRIRMVTNVGQAGIQQFVSNKEQINIYPNPNNGSFVIEPSNNTKQTMQVYDVNGKIVLSQTINGKTTIDASSLNEGVYNISLISNEGVVNKRLVIVR
ncbi:MAG TPA: T9SS type A sorting domain-containing protein [Bacteroidia bacterium]